MYEHIASRCAMPPLDCLLRYTWPGNVRELANAIQQAVILCEGDLIRPEIYRRQSSKRHPAKTMPH